MEVPKAASFAVRLSFAPPKQQEDLFSDGTQAIRDVMLLLQKLEEDRADEVRQFFIETKRIDHEQAMAYFRNFVGFARPFMPDGEVVSSVGVGWVSYTQVKSHVFKKKIAAVPKNSESPVVKVADGNLAEVTIEGKLYLADGRSGKVGLQVSKDRTEELSVKKGLQDIVKRFFEHKVLAKVETDGHGVKWLIDVDGI